MIQVLVPDRDAEFLVASLKMSSAALLNLRTVLQGVNDIQRMIDAQERLADQLIRMIVHNDNMRKKMEGIRSIPKQRDTVSGDGKHTLVLDERTLEILYEAVNNIRYGEHRKEYDRAGVLMRLLAARGPAVPADKEVSQRKVFRGEDSKGE